MGGVFQHENCLMQTAELTVTQGINHEFAFYWWVKHVLKKGDRIIARNRKWLTRYLKKSHKFCIELYEIVEQALALDAKNGNSLWVDAISKDLEDFKVAFMIIPDGKKAPIGHQFVQYHMIFDIRKRGFQM